LSEKSFVPTKVGIELKDFDGDFAPDAAINRIFRVNPAYLNFVMRSLNHAAICECAGLPTGIR